MDFYTPFKKYLNISSLIFYSRKIILFLAFFILSVASRSQTAVPPTVGDGSIGNPYQIATWQNLYWITQNSDEWDRNFLQTANINLSVISPSITTWIFGWPNIGNSTFYFTGSYDGGGHTVSGLYMSKSETDNVGLFGYCYQGGVTNLGVINANIKGKMSVGAVVGKSDLSVISKCFSTGTVEGKGGAIGGLCGNNNNSSISNCYSTCNIKVLSGYFAGICGGLIGCNNEGSVSSCFSIGTVEGDYNVGGLIGLNTGTVNNSFWDTQASDRSTSSGGTGKTTAQMKEFATFFEAGWDYKDESDNGTSEIWNIGNGRNNGYPYFNWQYPSDPNPMEPTSGDGSNSNPYQIATWQNIYWVTQNSDEWDKHFIQTADINLMGIYDQYTKWNNGWPVIGNSIVNFTGSYSGDGHIITNIFISNSEADNIGLFGFCNSAIIQNLGLVNVNISGRDYVGSIAGYYNGGTISNCFSTGSITGVDNIGGLVGNNIATLSNSYSNCSVNGSGEVRGGLCGKNSGSINYCYCTGNVNNGISVGGLVGLNTGTVINTFWDTVTSGQSASAGGTGKTTAQMKTIGTFSKSGWDFKDLWAMTSSVNNGYPSFLRQVGTGTWSLPEITTQDISNISTSTANLNGTLTVLGEPQPYHVGFCWGIGHDPVVSVDTTDNGGLSSTVSISETITGLESYTQYYARAYATNSNGTVYGNEIELITLPTILPPLVGDGTEGNPYEIETLSDLYWLSMTSRVWSKNFLQTADIEMPTPINKWDNNQGWTPIGNLSNYFSGSYNGNGYQISNLYINRPSVGYVGLFGWIDYGGTITNLGITNINVKGHHSTGGLVGIISHNASVSNCYSIGYVTATETNAGILAGSNSNNISNSYSSGNVTGKGYIGGLVGENNSNVSNSYSSGNVTGTYYLGGLIGNNSGAVSNSYSVGTASGSNEIGGLIGYNSGAVSNSYSVGTASGSSYIGGLIGRNYNATGYANNCFWDTQASERSTSAGGTGLTTLEMKTRATFTIDGWDFAGESANGTSDLWDMNPAINSGYPVLNSFYKSVWDGASWNLLPTATRNATINGDFADVGFSCTDITIREGFDFAVNPTQTVVVSGDIIDSTGTEGNILIKSDATGTGKLVNNTPGLNASVEQFFEQDQWHYYTIPISEPTAAFPLFKKFWLIGHYESQLEPNCWGYFAVDDILSRGIGYGAYFEAKDTSVTINRTLNTGDIVVNTSFTDVDHGWNLIGNPYPCTVDWNTIVSGGKLSNVNNAIYVWDPVANNYSSFIEGATGGAGTQNQYIAPMQGFFVRANTDAGAVTFTNASKTATASTFKSADLLSVISLSASDSEGRKDISVVRINPGATDKFDGELDAYKLKAETSPTPQLYSVYNGDIYSINSIPEIKDNTVIPFELMIKSKGEQTISLHELSGYNLEYGIWLEYVASGEKVNLLENESYTFIAEEASTMEFNLRFMQKTDASMIGGLSVKAYSRDMEIILRGMAQKGNKVVVYNINGQRVFSGMIDSSCGEVPVYKKGVYIVNVISEGRDKAFNGKVIVK